MYFHPGQPVYFVHNNATLAGVIRGGARYRLTLRSTEPRAARPRDGEQQQEGDNVYTYRVGSRFTAIVGAPRLPGELYNLDITGHLVPTMLLASLVGQVDWVWDSPSVPTSIEGCELYYSVRGQYGGGGPTVAQLDAKGSVEGELYEVPASCITERQWAR